MGDKERVVVNSVVALIRGRRDGGWTTRLRVSDVLDGQPIMLERNERVSMLSVHHVIIARKGDLAAA